MSKKIHVIVDSFFSNGEIENKVVGETEDQIKARDLALKRAESEIQYRQLKTGQTPPITYDDDNTGITRIIGNPSELDSTAFSTFPKIPYFDDDTK